MRNTMFASIGKAIIIRACGLMENSKEKILDRKKSGCFACQYYADILQSKRNPAKIASIESHNCSKCEKRCYTTKYNNEKNRYGYAPTLKTGALRTFLYLHFCAPSEMGVVSDFHVPTAATNLHVTEKTIHAALKKLEDTGYISYANSDVRGYYNVLLKEYPTYFLPAEKGGRGYITMAYEFLNVLCSVESLNVLRLYLREYINIDFKKQYTSTDHRTPAQLLSYLPYYCRISHVKKYLAVATPIFKVTARKFDYEIILNSSYNGESLKSLYLEESLRHLKSAIERDNQILHNLGNYTVNETTPRWLQEVLDLHQENPLPIIMTPEELDDCVKLCWQYNPDIVVEGIHQVYLHYKHSDIDNYGALLRTLIEDRVVLAA